MTNPKFRLVATALLAGSVTVQAQSIRPHYQYPTEPPASGPAAVQLGNSPFYFSPYIGLAVGRDDNVLLLPNAARSSPLYVVSPGFHLDARTERTVLQIGYQAQIARYTSSENDNYEDQTFTGQYDIAFDRRNFLRLELDHLRGHEPRGSTDRGPRTEPDKFKLTKAGGTYAFGAPGAAGRFETYYDDERKTYLNNRATTSLGDLATREFGGALYVRVAPRTYAVVEARGTRIKYKQPSQFDADERRYYGGISWEATGATTGTIKVGRLKREFDSDLPDYSGTSWEASITWAPRTYSKVEFYSSRQTNENTGLGNFIVSDATGVVWSHNWSSVLSTNVDLKYQRDDYQGFSRKDDTMSLGLKVGYRFRRWLTFGAEYTYTKRDSTLDSADYDKNLYFLTATASM
jgi:hypothetical protein